MKTLFFPVVFFALRGCTGRRLLPWSREAEAGSPLSMLRTSCRLDLKFTLALYSKGLSSLKKKKRGRDFEVNMNVLNWNWLGVPCDWGTEFMGDTW